jgi:23S rRNA (uracil1939-C5)-methyltransferase
MSADGERFRVERLIPGGDGFARAADGRAVFVSGGLPGDLVHAHRIEERRRHLRLLDWELVEPGEDRTDAPPCAEADRCGGCDWMHLDRPAQLRWKGALLQDALRRVGGIDVEVGGATAAGDDLGYRTRLRLHVDGRGRIGLFARRSRDLVAIPGCPVAAPGIDEALATLRRLSAGSERALAQVDAIELRAAPQGAPVIAVVGSRGRPSRALTTLAERWAEALPVVLDGRPMGPPAGQSWPLPGGVELRVPATCFVQVNPAVNRALVEAVLDFAGERGARSFVDLYCGSGNFSLPLLAAGLEGVGIEGSPEACAAARQAADEAGHSGRFVAGPAGPTLARLGPGLGPIDLVVLDPPRAGAKEALDPLLALAPASVAYVSCDPATLARDLRVLCAAGYALAGVRAFDMFPWTHHVEALALLTC